MPIIKSAKKRVRITERKTRENRIQKNRLKRAEKEFTKALEENDLGKAQENHREVVSLLDKLAKKGIIHKNKASRKKSRLTQRLNQKTG